MICKTPQDIAAIRAAGVALGEVLAVAKAAAKPGLLRLELDALIAREIEKRGARPSFFGHHGYEYVSCLSVNEQVVHGIPTRHPFMEGDVLGIDAGLWLGGVCTDAAITMVVGDAEVPKETERLLRVTKEALNAGIGVIKPGRRIGLISHTIQQIANREGLGIVRALSGHGVGKAVWEEPEIPNFGSAHSGMIIKEGMVLAIEPMFTLGTDDVLTELDGWGIVTADGSLAAQFEHTVLVTRNGAEILTK